MTSHDFRATLERLGLRQIQAAALLGQSKDTISRYALGKLPVPEPVRRLLLACETHPDLLAILTA
jgi:transcriptional regulator with XRE-family HTH domain